MYQVRISKYKDWLKGNLWKDSRIQTELISGKKHNHSTSFARKGLSDLLNLKNSQKNVTKSAQISPRISGTTNLRALLHKPARQVTPNIPEINNSFSSKNHDSLSLSDEISDPSSDSETMSCFRGSISRHNFSTKTRKSGLSTTQIKPLISRPSITVMLNENLQCVIQLNGDEMGQISRLTKRYNLSVNERRKLTTLVEQARKGGRLDRYRSPGF